MSTQRQNSHCWSSGISSPITISSIGQDRGLAWLRVKPFVKRVHDMIEKLTEDGGRVAQWMDGGEMFVIKSKIELQQHFKRFGFKKMKHYRSLEKQLNDYGFQKVQGISICDAADSPHAVFFMREHFRRKCPENMHLIVDRRSLNGSAPRKGCHSPSTNNIDESSQKEEAHRQLKLQLSHLEHNLVRMETVMEHAVNKMHQDQTDLLNYFTLIPDQRQHVPPTQSQAKTLSPMGMQGNGAAPFTIAPQKLERITSRTISDTNNIWSNEDDVEMLNLLLSDSLNKHEQPLEPIDSDFDWISPADVLDADIIKCFISDIKPLP
jgi:hypothetical protein